ncbi:MAG TPA: class I SAM-dependent methyltransferase [Gemmatimonadales bacterium]|jgi:2-polyprenyl-3-methyl-5-hydroxy-6-metoxy-1,4-benzoquinol methylase|nr:class I SAM-dependent methyltransferase [Gemmatimonadales bacterium]
MNCKLCGATDLPLFYTQGDRRQYRFYRCPRCRLVVYDTRTGVNQEKYILSRVDPEAPTRQNRGHWQTHAFIRRHAAAPGRLLDLGCGDGTVLCLARKDGWTVKGVELFPEQTALVRAQLGLDVETSDIMTFNGGSEAWDCVVLTHVLEHLPDPLAALRKIRDLLKPGGVGVLEFPNIDALDARLRRLLDRLHIHRRHYAPTYAPGHVQEFCRASFAFAAERAGLALEVWETYAVNPVKYFLFRLLPIGNKARVLVRRPR